jgi:hypothetical protein
MVADLSADDLIASTVADDGLRRAQLYVCGQATDTDDAQLLPTRSG